MMRVLIATPLYPPETGGPATYTKQLEETFPEYGIEVSIAAFSAVRHLPRIVRHIAYFFILLKKSRSTDCIYAQDPASVGLPALGAARLRRKPFLLKVVGDYAWEQYAVRTAFFKLDSIEQFQQRRYGVFTELRRGIERFVARRATRLITPSAFLKRIVVQWGVPAERIAVIYNAFELPEQQAPKETLRAAFAASGPILISAGRLVPWKGFAALIERVMPALVPHFPNITLMIAGDGPERARLQRLIDEKNLGEHVMLCGALAPEVLYRYIKAADVFLLNTFYEGFSHQLLEAMALGTPVVTTDVGGNPETIEDGVSGVLVPYGESAALAEAAERLLRDPDYARDLAAGGQKQAAQFSKARMAGETAEMLKSVCKS